MKRLFSFITVLFAFTIMLNTLPHFSPKETALPVFQDSPLSLCTFFGDSTTYGLFRYNAHNDGRFGKNYYTLQDSQIWTPKEGTFYLGNVLKASVCLGGQSCTLPDACKRFSPQKLILTVGINGLATWEKESFLRYYEKLINVIRKASPDTKIYLQSIYPIAEIAKEKLPSFDNRKIDTVNLWIASLAQNKELPYLDTATVLKDNNGNLCEAYHNGDGLHLSCDGFNAMLRFVEEQLTKETV